MPNRDAAPGCLTVQHILSVATVCLLAGNLLVFGRIAAGIGQISDHLAASAEPIVLRPPVPGQISATASGNVVNVASAAVPSLPPGPRTVEQVADYLGVTPDTVRESYIPAWILDGHMGAGDRLPNRWQIPETFTPYRPK